MGTHIALAILLSGFVTSMTDWFFAGVLFHDKYLAYPEIWRRTVAGSGETKSVAWSIVLGFVTCGAFVLACIEFKMHGYGAALRFAGLVFLIAPLPLVVTNSLFIKMHPLTVVSHSLGWIVKLCVAALAVGWFF
jgi:hypothetical protein